MGSLPRSCLEVDLDGGRRALCRRPWRGRIERIEHAQDLAQLRGLAGERPGHPLVDRRRVARRVERDQRGAQLGRGLPAMVRIAFERPHDDVVEGGRHVAPAARWTRDPELAEPRQRVEIVLAVEQPVAGQQLVRDHADREQVGAAIERAGEVLGGDVGELALDQAGLRAGLAVTLDDAEIDQLHHAVCVDHDVGQRHVAVDQIERRARVVAQVVDVLERVADLDQDPDHDADRHRASDLTLARELVQRRAVYVLHLDEVRAVGLAERVGLRDVRVIEPLREVRLLDEPAHDVEVDIEVVVGVQLLERDGAPVRVDLARLGAVHDRHRAASELFSQHERPELVLGHVWQSHAG